jgi:hypothetical protein
MLLLLMRKKAPSLIRDDAKKDALRDIVIFPVIMLVSYLLLILHFRTKADIRLLN